MSDTARAKYQTTAPAEFRGSLTENPRKDYNSPGARPSGKSGGVVAHTPHRVSSSRRPGAKTRSRRRG
jgi:hypothetical protein